MRVNTSFFTARSSVTGLDSLYIPLLVRGTAIVLLVFIVPLEFIIRGLLTQNEDSLITSMQKSRSKGQDDFFQGVSYTGGHTILVFLLPVLYNVIDPAITFKIGIVSCHSLYLCSLISVIFTEPRPYYVHSDIKGINCEKGYGVPSEQILFGMVFYFYLIVEVFEKNKHPIRGFLYAILSIWIVLVGYAEMYLGESFLHQLLLTAILGYIYLTAALTLDPYVSQIALASSFYSNKNRKAKVYWFIASMAMMLILLTITTNIHTNSSISIIWIKNAYKQCQFSTDVSGDSSFNQSSWIFYNLGAVFGVMDSTKTLQLGWWKNSYWLRGLRSIISSGIAYSIYYGFSQITTYDNTSTFAFNCALPVFICAYTSFGVMPLIFEKLGMNFKERYSTSFASGISLNSIDG